MKLSLQEKLEVLKQLDSEILNLVDEDDLADEIEQSDDFKEGIYATMVKIEEHCVHSRSLPSPGSSPRSSPGRDSAKLTSPPRVNKVKLPKLTIRPFNGDLTAWITFWDPYKAAIHDNPALSDIDKFNYLRSLLERAALEAISGLTLTAANYQEAISILEKRFGNKQQIVAKHMDILLNVEAVMSQYNLKGLRHLYDLIESQVRSLKSLGVSSDSYGCLLSSVLMNKLPQELRLIISRKIGDDDWNLDALMEVMEDEIQARERTATNPTNHGKKPSREQPTAAALFSGSSNAGPTCCYCRQAHSSNICGTVTQVEARKRILRKSG